MPDSGRVQGTPRNNSVMSNQQEQRLKKIIETAGALIIGLDRKGSITLFNKRCEEVTGYSRQEVMGKTIFSLLIPKEQQASVQQVFKDLKTGVLPSHFVNEWETKSGERRLIEWNNTTITDREGTVQEVIGVGIDITEQQQAKEALLESERRYRLLYENLSDGIHITDTEAIITMCSKRAAEIFGYTTEEVVGSHIGKYFHPDDRQRGLKAFRIGLKTLMVLPGGMEWKGIHKDGSTMYFHVASTILMKDDKPQGYQFLIRDITKRKNAEIALQKSEERFRDIAESTSDWIWEVDADGVYTYASGNIEEVLGYTAEELLGKTPFDLMPPDEAEKIGQIFAQISAQKDRIVDLENWNLHKDGHLVCLLTNGVPLLDAEDNLVGYRGVDKDITDRKRVETALQESEARYRSLFDSVPLGLYRSTPEGQIIDVNPGLVHMLGYPDRESLVATNAADLYFDAMARKQWQVLFEREGVVRGFEAQFRRHDGTTIWVRDNARAIRDANDQVLYYEGSLEDITERKQAEAALRRSEARYRELITLLPEGVAIVDLDERFTFMNSAFTSMLGYDRQELLGMSVIDLIDEIEIAKVRTETEKRKTGKSTTYELDMMAKDGSLRVVRIHAVPMRGKNGSIQGTIAVVSDITERKRAELDLKQSHRDLELYASLLRHDLGNDLQLIFSNSEVAEMLLSPDSELRGFNEATRAAADRMVRLLSLFARPDKDIEKEIVVLLERLASQAEKAHKQLKVVVNAKPETRHLQVGGGRLLPIVFNNLFRNAAQYAGPKTKVQVTVSTNKDQVQIDVVDDGPGIPAEIRSKLFQRGVSTTGGGLGLYLGQRILEAYGGSIKLLRRRHGQGAAFRITLPLAKT